MSTETMNIHQALAIYYFIKKYPITKAPSIIRYHPNPEKLCFLTKFIKNLIATIDTA